MANKTYHKYRFRNLDYKRQQAFISYLSSLFQDIPKEPLDDIFWDINISFFYDPDSNSYKLISGQIFKVLDYYSLQN